MNYKNKKMLNTNTDTMNKVNLIKSILKNKHNILMHTLQYLNLYTFLDNK
jgi:hypothetical protein